VRGGSQCLKKLFEKDLYSRLRNFVVGIKVEPDEVAEIVIDRVMDFCENNRGDKLECMADHSPDQLDVFIDAYLKENEAEDLEKAIENSDNFWDEVKKEYEKMWNRGIGLEVAYFLGNELDLIPYSIIENDGLDDASKVRYLKAYDEVLYKFSDAIKRALQDGKPLSPEDLYDWYMKIADVVSIKSSDYSEEVSYFLDFYSMLDDDGKLEMLSNLLDDIANVLYDIEEKYLPDLGVLRNS